MRYRFANILFSYFLQVQQDLTVQIPCIHTLYQPFSPWKSLLPVKKTEPGPITTEVVTHTPGHFTSAPFFGKFTPFSTGKRKPWQRFRIWRLTLQIFLFPLYATYCFVPSSISERKLDHHLRNQEIFMAVEVKRKNPTVKVQFFELVEDSIKPQVRCRESRKICRVYGWIPNSCHLCHFPHKKWCKLRKKWDWFERPRSVWHSVSPVVSILWL